MLRKLLIQCFIELRPCSPEVRRTIVSRRRGMRCSELSAGALSPQQIELDLLDRSIAK